MKQIAIIGGGPAGLMAAQAVCHAGHRALVFDAKPSLARKFLMAGKSGLNITHCEPLEIFLSRYGAAQQSLAPFIENFSPDVIRLWMETLGQEVFIGSSGRVFPKGWKASPLLRQWLARLNESGAQFHLSHRWQGWEGDALLFDTPQGNKKVSSDAVILALGGNSWPRLGSDGSWAEILAHCGVELTPFAPSNVGVKIHWSDYFRDRFVGEPLKAMRFSAGDTSSRGEAVVTRQGMEGSGIYTVSAELRKFLTQGFASQGAAMLKIDLLPDWSIEKIRARYAEPRGKHSLSNHLRKKLNLSPLSIALIREAGITLDNDPSQVKQLPLNVHGLADGDKAISTSGGVQWRALDESLMLKKIPGVYCAGEMLDWDAPTGGYLLTACLALGKAAGEAASKAD